MTAITPKEVLLDGIRLTPDQTRQVLEEHGIELEYDMPSDGVYTDRIGDFWAFYQGKAFFIAYHDGDAMRARKDHERGGVDWDFWAPYTKVS